MKTKEELDDELFEELSCSFGSTQIIKFGFGIEYAMHGFDIPEDLYPLPTSKYLAEQYKSSSAESWQIMLWATTAMIQLHQRDLSCFDTSFNLWFPEKKLHKTIESFASCVFVLNGVVTGELRCTQCGQKLNEENIICFPCWKYWAPHTGLKVDDIDRWAKEKNLKVAYTSIWDNFK